MGRGRNSSWVTVECDAEIDLDDYVDSEYLQGYFKRNPDELKEIQSEMTGIGESLPVLRHLPDVQKWDFILKNFHRFELFDLEKLV